MALDENTTTLKEAKAWLRERLNEGADCPCCAHFAKLYKRKLNAGMAVMLVKIYRKSNELKPQDGWLHISKLFLDEKKNAVAQEYSKLRYWGLLEPSANTDPTIPGSGWWRITEHGRAFVEGKTTVPKLVGVYDNRKITLPPALALEQVSIREALGDKFNYDELMRGGI